MAPIEGSCRRSRLWGGYLSFPLFRQHINLVCELCQIFIGHSLTTSCNCKQSFRRGNKSAEYSRSTFCSFLFLHAYAVRLYNHFTCQQIVTSTAVRCNRIIAVFISDTIGKFIARLFLAMINKNNFRQRERSAECCVTVLRM